MGDYRIIVRDKQLVPVGQIDEYIEFNAVLKFCDTGQWTLKVQADRRNTLLLQPGCGILVYREGVQQRLVGDHFYTCHVRVVGPQRVRDLLGCDPLIHVLRMPDHDSRGGPARVDPVPREDGFTALVQGP